MNFFLVLPYYLVWHYGRAYSDIKSVWKNFLIFVYHFFSIPVLLTTLFSPWERMKDSYKSGSPLFETLIFNTIMRVLGFVIRIFFILLGMLCIAALVLGGIVFYIVWLLLPFLLSSLFIWGFGQIFI